MDNWVDDTIIIDFFIPHDIQPLIQLCEEANKNDDFGYFNYVESLDYGCKEAVLQGDMTEKEWETIKRRYESYD